jgi:hypothetical protein
MYQGFRVLIGATFFLWAGQPCAQDFPHSRPVPPELRETAASVAQALAQGDLVTLQALAENSADFNPETREGAETYRSYFTTDYKSIGGKPPLAGLIAGDKVVSRVFVESESKATTYFIPKRFVRDSLSERKFFDKMFMKKYFACTFTRVNGKWKISGSCFAGTSGPFASDVG